MEATIFGKTKRPKFQNETSYKTCEVTHSNVSKK
jgi:hypothetical protein